MAIDAYLQIDGIKGESTDDKHKDSIIAFDKALHVASVLMRYWLNVYWAGSVYLGLCFYTSWARSRHSLNRHLAIELLKNNAIVLSPKNFPAQLDNAIQPFPQP